MIAFAIVVNSVTTYAAEKLIIEKVTRRFDKRQENKQ
jgi:hypothetical protein